MIRKILKKKQVRKTSTKVNVLKSNITKLKQDMLDTLKVSGGIGLAAPQIGSFRRVILISEPDKKPYFLINPEIYETSGVEVLSMEACLSVPKKNGTVFRHDSIKFKYTDEKTGEERRACAEDLEAFIIQHEIDHLDGILFTDKLSKAPTPKV